MVDVFKSKNMAWWNDDDMEKRSARGEKKSVKVKA